MDSMQEIFIKGGPVMWPLLACSLIAMTFILDRLFFWFRENHRSSDEAFENVLALIERNSSDEARVEASRRKDATSRMVATGLLHRRHGLEEALQMQAQRELDRMKRGLSVLDTIITLAPLLGILGTVTGIIGCFQLLSIGGALDPRAATSGLAEALITTASGLIVSLTTLVPYNIFVSRVARAARYMEHAATQVLVAYRKSEEARRVPHAS